MLIKLGNMPVLVKGKLQAVLVHLCHRATLANWYSQGIMTDSRQDGSRHTTGPSRRQQPHSFTWSRYSSFSPSAP